MNNAINLLQIEMPNGRADSDQLVEMEVTKMDFENINFETPLSSDQEKIIIEDYKSVISNINLEEFDPTKPWVQTYSGLRFTPTDPRKNQIHINDIAHALSMQCRFTGHSESFYSVAQHCVLVSYICDSQDALWGLMHDASEAYIGDISTPLKHSGKMKDYLVVEENLMRVICEKFNLSTEQPSSVKTADRLLLATEARDLMNMRDDWDLNIDPLPFKIIPVNNKVAKEMFIKRFYQLGGKF